MKTRTRRSEILVLLLLLALALVPRVLAFTSWNETPGDGPARAILAYNWAKDPYLVLHNGGWPPGHMYVAGLFSFIISDPMVSTRVLNLVLGTLTVPLSYFLWRHLFGRAVAVSAAGFLAFLPLHIGLSATSLSDAMFLFEFMAGLLLLTVAAETAGRRWYYLAPSLLMFSLAAMTRYEAWLIVPLLPAYYFIKKRDSRGTLVFIVTLLAFPLAWLVGNRVYTGDFFHGILVAVEDTRGTPSVFATDLTGAIKAVGRKSVTHMGWIPLILAAAGAAFQFSKIVRRRISHELALYLATLVVFWSLFLAVALIRGWRSLGDRYALVDLVLILPFVFLIVFTPTGSRRTFTRGVIGLTVPAVGLSLAAVTVDAVRASDSSVHSPVYLTRRWPVEIQRIAAWLRASPYRQGPVLLTMMDWEATYLPLYLPEVASRHLVVSSWTREHELREFLLKERPVVLITRDDDAEFWPAIDATGGVVRPSGLVHEEGSTRVYLMPPSRPSGGH